MLSLLSRSKMGMRNCTSSCPIFLYIASSTRKGGIVDRFRAMRDDPFFFAKGGKMKGKKKKTELVAVKPGFSLIDENLLKSRIYTIRGVKVMLDADLAEIYGYSTGSFNRQVRNNIEKFDDDFRFQLTKEELSRCKNCILKMDSDEKNSSKSKIFILNHGGRGSNIKFMPYAFTEQGSTCS